MAQTYTPIAAQTLTSTSAQISFSSIPSTYTDLVLVTASRSTKASTNDLYYCYVNNSSTTDYSWTRIIGDGTSVSSYSATGYTAWVITYSIPAANSTANTYGLDTMQFMNYANTTTKKSMLWRSGNLTGNPMSASLVGLRSNTAAIDRIDLVVGSGSFAIGSTFTLYGIKAA
jgi:hypothetical protein